MLALYAELGTTPSYPQELRKAAYTLPARLRVTLHPQHNAGLRTITQTGAEVRNNSLGAPGSDPTASRSVSHGLRPVSQWVSTSAYASFTRTA